MHKAEISGTGHKTGSTEGACPFVGGGGAHEAQREWLKSLAGRSSAICRQM